MDPQHSQRTCLNCSGPIVQRANENNFRYKTRKFCKDTCYHEYYRKNKMGWYRSYKQREQDALPSIPTQTP